MQEFQRKVGWDSVKEQIGAIITASNQNYDKEIKGERPLNIPLNCLVLGNPGTGKTTCAKLYGELLKAMGVLSNGKVVYKVAGDFIKEFQGQSGSNTANILKAICRWVFSIFLSGKWFNKNS